MNNVPMFGPSAEIKLSGAASISLIMNTDCQTCLRNLLQHQLKTKATVIDFPTQCGRDGKRLLMKATVSHHCYHHCAHAWTLPDMQMSSADCCWKGWQKETNVLHPCKHIPSIMIGCVKFQQTQRK